jgi:hypothetical protein
MDFGFPRAREAGALLPFLPIAWTGSGASSLRRFHPLPFFSTQTREPVLATANRYVAFVPAVEKSWGGQKIAHMSYGYNASLSAVGNVE